MLVVNGKVFTDTQQTLEKFDKVVTLYAVGADKGRALKGGTLVPAKKNVSIPMMFTVSDPTKNGTTMRVVYDPYVIPFDTNGNVDPKYTPYSYKIKSLQTRIRKDENQELLWALAHHNLNSENVLYEISGKQTKAHHEFRLPVKGKVAKQSIDADTMLMKAFSYLLGATKVSDKKIYDIYKFYNLDPDISENEDVEGMIVLLKNVAKADPAKFIKDINESMYDMLARITEAFEIGILKDNDGRKVTWGEIVEERDHKKTICTYSKDTEKVQGVLEWLMKYDTDDIQIKNTLLKQLELHKQLV